MQDTKVAVQELAQKITGAMPALGSSERQLVVQLYRLSARPADEPVECR